MKERILKDKQAQHIKSTQIEKYDNFFWGGTMGYNHRIFQLSPQLMYRVNYHKINLYIKAGPNLLWAKNYISQYYKTSIDIQGRSGLTFKEAEKHGYTVGKCNIGLQSSLGVEYPMSHQMALFGEILLVNTNYHFHKYLIESYEINGTNQIDENTEMTYDMPAKNSNYSEIGLNLGVKYAF